MHPLCSCYPPLPPLPPQSGGLVTLVGKGTHTGSVAGAGALSVPRPQVGGIRRRAAPSKRQSLAVLLGKQFRRAAGKAEHADGHGIFVGERAGRLGRGGAMHSRVPPS